MQAKEKRLPITLGVEYWCNSLINLVYLFSQYYSSSPLGDKTTANDKSSSSEKVMRRVIEPQMKLGELAIADIKLDPKSRDDIPQILRGLQHIYTTAELREPIFTILEEVLPERQIDGKTVKVDPNNGRPGMTQWQILVLGVLRLGLNADYDSYSGIGQRT